MRRLQPDDDDDDIDWDAGPPVRPEPYPPPFKRRPPTVRELNEADGLDPMVLDLPLLPDGPGEHGEPAWARGAAMPGDRIGPRLKCGLWLSSDCPVADTRGYVDCLLWHVDCLACEPLSEAP